MFYNQILIRNYGTRILFKSRLLNDAFRVKRFNLIENDQLKTPWQIAPFQTHSHAMRKDPESKAEQTVNLIKEKILKEKEKARQRMDDGERMALPVDIEQQRPSLWDRIVKELQHYYHGFRLLYFETKIAWGLLKKVLRGESLTRRERRQFTRTSADLFRLVPFSIFIIVPFMEFALPIFLKLFPNMLPSTFKEKSVEQEKLRKRLKAKLEMAKFLQDTVEETALRGDSNENTLNIEFAEFMKKIRSKGEQPSSDQILRFSSLFENELTLENLSRQQLIALCQILDVNTLANIPTNHILRFQLRLKIRNLEADDQMILKEGVDNLTIEELQQCCRDRGMRAVGLSETRLRNQLDQWLDLHLNRRIPLSLLILSRAMYLPENLPPEDLIKTTISALPKSIEDATMARIAEATGAKIDNRIKLELLRQEQDEITKEHDVERRIYLEGEIGPGDIRELNDIIENMPANERKQFKGEIDELKKDIDEYDEDVKEVEQFNKKLTQTRSARIMNKRIKKLITDLETIMDKIDTDGIQVPNKDDNMVSIDELVETIKRIKGPSSEKKIVEILKSLDTDKDGKLEDLNYVLKVLFE
ncbi:LETM1 and EF-hand domain-containing [Brachionus plicatilis]|uniref:Mitochondrial proton/calcium exchanger protein n=1 Tax=Brachionus plicatilis TaxID=10195 RepID=A0A3M7SCQ7_BRAPC|nr:LETM1 and EF-hand domain-containing [Brachionus plicatilis]